MHYLCIAAPRGHALDARRAPPQHNRTARRSHAPRSLARRPRRNAEQLAIGETGALFVEIPASITFDAGDLYQLWLQARNSRGSSEAGPKQNWVAT
jgi:hypothetical protein